VGIAWSVFTKPWPRQPLVRLAYHVRLLGFDAIELPVRPGFQVEPADAGSALPEAVRLLASLGVRVASVAAEPDVATIEACGAAGVPLLRTMARIAPEERYTAAEARLQQEYGALTTCLKDSGVKLGIQNHVGSFVPNALGLRALLEELDPDCFVAVWDAAHEALAGSKPEYALDVVAPRLGLVNLKNGYWSRRPSEQGGGWETIWCDARSGLADWAAVCRAMQRIGYQGDVCLTAEYSEREGVDRRIAADLQLAREVFSGYDDFGNGGPAHNDKAN
jgi:sugar phosphate isomerase/epimerase